MHSVTFDLLSRTGPNSCEYQFCLFQHREQEPDVDIIGERGVEAIFSAPGYCLSSSNLFFQIAQLCFLFSSIEHKYSSTISIFDFFPCRDF